MLQPNFLRDVALEVERARELFPNSDGVMCALTEEVGEVAKAHMDEPWSNVYAECVQVAAMAMRVAMEGDPTLLSIRKARGAIGGPTCDKAGCEDPFRQRQPCGLCYE